MRSIKCVVIGDGAVGKTSLLISYTTNTFPTDYVPTVFDNYTTTISVNPPLSYNNNNNNIPHDVNLFKLNLWDTAGQEEYDRLRPLSYPQTDIFLLCFAINERTSFKNLKEKWIPELKQHANIENNDMWQSFHKLPIILIGTKSDLRDESVVDDEDCVDTDDINAFVEHNHLLKYVECSAKNQTGINEIFQTVVQKLVYEYDPISLKPKQAESSTSTSTQQQQLQASPPTPPPEKIEKKLSNKEPKKKQSSSINTTTQLQKKRSIHHEKVSSSSSSTNNNKPPKTNRRKTSCIIM